MNIDNDKKPPLKLASIFVGSCFIFIGCTFGEHSVDVNVNGITKLVKKITIDIDTDVFVGVFPSSYEFTYDDNKRVSSVFWMTSETHADFINIEYDSNQIVVKERGNNRSMYAIDNNGYIVSGEGVPFPARENIIPGTGGTEYVSATYEYSNGYISNVNYRPKGYFSWETQVNSYTWENGNLIQIIDQYRDRCARCTRTRTYNNVENKLNIDIVSFGVNDLYYFQCRDPEVSSTYIRREFNILKFKGWSSKNFPVSETWSYKDGTGSTTTYKYTFDSDGYPTKVTASSNHHTYPANVVVSYTYY